MATHEVAIDHAAALLLRRVWVLNITDLSSHGVNQLLRQRDPDFFRFSIPQRAAPDMSAEDVIRLDRKWKDRLRTRNPSGLNDN